MLFTDTEERAILERSGLPQIMPAHVLEELRKRYSEPKRHYHDWTHALSVLSWVNHVYESDLCPWMGGFSHYDLRFAALFHDVIYDASKGAPHNEIASAELFRKYLLDGTITHGLRTDEIILATAQHGKTQPEDLAPPIRLFLDCDIASWGEMRWEVAKWHDDNIIREYTYFYPREQVIEGRKKFLRGIIVDGRRIFMSDYFSERLGRQARHNIERLIKDLEAE
jgi:predicted metal-dependent HD superfamily phosphohydrolase